MISDEEQISDTDSEPPSPQSPQVPFLEHLSDVEKRQYHNLLERNRRNVLKYSFWKLRCAIPSLAKKKLVMNEKKASRAKILKRAIEYIHRAEQKRPARLRDIRDLQRENAQLEEHFQALQNVEETGDTSNVESIFRSIDEIKQKVYEEEPSDTEDDDEDTDDAGNGPDNEAVGPADPRMEWSSDNEYENNEPEQGWSVNVSEESESSDSDESSEDSSSDNE